MKIHARRFLCLVLAVLIVLGLPFTAMASELENSTVETVASEEAPPTETTEETVPETEAVTEPVMDSEASEEDSEMILGAVPDDDSSTYASTQKNIMLFDYADNGNYTTVLNYQVSCAYKPNGSGTTRTAYIKNLGWHFARYGGVPYPDNPLYCIEPWRNYAASTSGNSVDRDVTLDGSGSTSGSNVWYALPAARREAISLILLYSNQMWNHSISVTTTSKANNPNVPLRIATQFLIYEIVCGLRDPNTFTLNSTNECGTAGNIFYNAGTLMQNLAADAPVNVLHIYTSSENAKALENALREHMPSAYQVNNYQNQVDINTERQEGRLLLMSWIFSILMLVAMQIIWVRLAAYVQSCAPMLKILFQVGGSRRQLLKLIPVWLGAASAVILPYLIAIPWIKMQANRHFIVSGPVLCIYAVIAVFTVIIFWLPVKYTLHKILENMK